MALRFRPAGTDALLVECGSLAEAMALHAEAVRRDTGARDVVPGARTVLFDGVSPGLAEEIDSWTLGDGAGPVGGLVEIPTTYDGPDLADVAREWGTGVDEVVALHTATELVVAFCGFAPGFGYLAGLPRSTARLPTPRPRVEAGAVGLAGEFTGVYPRASPGGWRLIGRTDVVLWDAARESPALLAPGTRVRFTRA